MVSPPMKNKPYLIAIFMLLCLAGCLTPTPDPGPTLTPTPVSPINTPAATAAPTNTGVITHPELEVIGPDTVARLGQIDQWGQGNINGIALSPNGSLIAVSTTTGVYLYDRETARQVGYINIRVGENNNAITQECPTTKNLAFHPDGSILAIAGTDITLWNLETNTVQAVIKNKIEDPASIITSIQFSLDGSRIFGLQKKNSVYFCYLGWGSLVIYAIDTGELTFRQDYDRYEEGPAPIFSEKNGNIFISYLDTQKQTYSILEVNMQTGNILADRPVSAIDSMNASAAVIQKWISTGDYYEGYWEAHIIDLASFEEIEMLNARVDLIPRSNRMIIRQKQHLTVRTLDGVIICSKPTAPESAKAFLPEIFSWDGRIAIGWNDYGYQAGEIRVWDLEQCIISEPILIMPEVAREIAFSSDGASMLTGSRAGYTFFVFDVQTGQVRFLLSGLDAAFSADGQHVFVVEEEAVNAYDARTGKYSYTVLKIDSDYSADILVSPDGQFIVLDKHIYRIDGGSLGKLPDCDINGEIFFSQASQLMAIVQSNRATDEISVWDLSTGEPITNQKGIVLSDDYNEPVFNSNFTQLATFGTDGRYQNLYLWNVPEFTFDKVLFQSNEDRDRLISDFRFVSNDRLLFAFASTPDAFLFWEVDTGDLISEIPVEIHEGLYGGPLAISPDGRLITVIDFDGTIHVWGVMQP
jgi:WD40 repeat protein